MHLIYCYQHNVNKKRYIGQTVNLSARHQNHLIKRRGNKQNLLIDKKIRQYGMENFTLTILQSNIDTQEFASEREIYWIAFFKTNICRHGPEFGYNLCDGGMVRSGHKLSEQTKKKIGDSNRGPKNAHWGVPLTKEHKQKLSDMFAGHGNPMYGKKHSQQSITKLKQSHLGLPSGNKGKYWSVESKNRHAKFSPEQIAEIKILYDNKIKIQDIAAKYNRKRHSITELAKRNKWPARRKLRQ